MPIGAFTGSFDLPLLLVIVFFLFFLCLVYHLHQEDKREGYPLVAPSRRGKRVPVVGFPALPKPKVFHRPHGLPPVLVPRADDRSPTPDAPFEGNPNGMPIDDGTPRMGQSLGPGSWVERDDEPDRSHDGRLVFRPMRWATDFHVMKGEADPRGYLVLGCDKAPAGRVVDIWIDDSEHYAKFLEVELDGALAAARPASALPARDERVVATLVTDTVIATEGGFVEEIAIEPVTAADLAQDAGRGRDTGRARDDGRDDDERLAPTGTVLLPIEFAAVDASRRQVRTAAITGAQFAGVPGRRRDVVLTAREENRLRGYYGGGYLWATPRRAEPLL